MRASNLGVHETLEVAFPSGMTLLRGRNGSGKSTMLAGLFFALAGDHPEEGKTKASLLAWGARKGWVEVDFEAEGKAYKVRRALDAAAASLEGGEAKITGAKNVDAAVADLLGMDRDSLLLAAFMSQRDSTDILTATESKRLREWARLAGFKHAERVRERLRAASAEIPPRQDMAQRLEALRASLADNEKRTAAVEASLAPLAETAAAAKAAALVYIPSGIKASEKALRIAENAISLEKTLVGLMALPPRAEVKPPPDAGLRAKAAAWSRAYELAGAIAEAEQGLKAMPEAAAVERELATARQEAEAETVRSGLSAVRSGLKAGMTCPVCDSILAADPGQILSIGSNHRAAARRLESELAARRKADDRLAGLRADFDKSAAMAAGFDKVAYDAAMTAAEGAALAARGNKARDELEAEVVRLHEAGLRLKDIAAVPDDTPDPALLRKAADDASIILIEAKSELRHLQSLKAMLVLELSEIEAWEALRAVEDAQRSFLEGSRAALAPDAAPRAAAAALAAPLAQAVSAQLFMMGAPFSLSITSELEPRAVKDGRNVSPRDLSGGQRAMLAVAVRLALVETLAGGVPFLVLDEPTPHLDEPNREALAAALTATRDSLAASGIQMIVCSHEQELLPAADAEIVFQQVGKKVADADDIREPRDGGAVGADA
jgi:exonuclease SbcC